jgi:hypothetical protein
MDHAIPTDQHLQILESRLGQAWFDWNKSIVDWRYGDGDGEEFKKRSTKEL